MYLDPAGGDGLLSWYGFNCWSDAEGYCGTMSYRIGSFTVMLRTDPESDVTCLIFAEMGGAKGRPVRATVSIVVVVVFATWLML